jgi:hypothetical protein
MSGPYRRAQQSLAELKAAIHSVLEEGPEEGLRNVEIGRTLGIYEGHEGHEGHIPRTLLAMMEEEGVVEQDGETGRWHLRSHTAGE